MSLETTLNARWNSWRNKKIHSQNKFQNRYQNIHTCVEISDGFGIWNSIFRVSTRNQPKNGFFKASWTRIFFIFWQISGVRSPLKSFTTMKNHQIWQKIKKSLVRFVFNPFPHGTYYTLCTILTILLTLWNSEQKNGLLIKLFCFSSDFDETWLYCSIHVCMYIFSFSTCSPTCNFLVM